MAQCKRPWHNRPCRSGGEIGPAADAYENDDPFDDQGPGIPIGAATEPNSDNLEPESQGTANVNRLLVLNTSNRPLYLMPGEVISGGQQDRTIGEELVLEPSGKPQEVEVFCVEQGRWGDRDADVTAALANSARAFSGSEGGEEVDAQQLAKRVGQGEFVASVGQLNKRGRMAVQASKQQGAVWDEVSTLAAAVDSDTPTDNFNAAYVNPQWSISSSRTCKSCRRSTRPSASWALPCVWTG